MTLEQPDYAAVLADLERRQVEIETAIVAIKQIIAGGGDAALNGRGGGLRSDSFFQMGILDAAKKYLAAVSEPKVSADIATALREGGLVSRAKDFPTTLYTTLKREDDRHGAVVQMPDKSWGLSVWYWPNGRPIEFEGEAVAVASSDSEGSSTSEPAQPD